jgi:hypothetical protein
MTELNEIKPGRIVKDKHGLINYGLPMQVIGEREESVIVAFLNLNGNYQESWLFKSDATLVETNNPHFSCPAFS